MNRSDHPPHCACVRCAATDPRYAGKHGTARSLIERLSRRGVSFRLVAGKVRFRPAGRLTQEERNGNASDARRGLRTATQNSKMVSFNRVVLVCNLTRDL